MLDPNKLRFAELYQQIESLYESKQYEDIIEFDEVYLQLDSSNLDPDKLQALAGMFARAYMKHGQQEKKPGLIRQFKMSLWYANLGGGDSDIMNWKLSLEEAVLMRYVKVNKYILYLILLSILLVSLDLLPSNNDYLPELTGVAVVWYVLNIVMNCRVKRLYLNLMRLIYS
ncbi:hypothetical protein DWB61_10550 [Ancylomarina euxinus]|uniref:Uncharacterized protein n=1 Tax=Ancylomarina euxinus TaxID=2283627 RepID=A0A425Y0C8_9BACT|nr:hypothetical protein [Ancylomarina euxinus]MCZ4695267.1 hypothetical protein [Ancylomarina euxinus]MUP15464.1 hypothetical protein [Ancylomarina euxinus]RRG21173.1 hypothetical protein DWB61_10550 [Ancylomarina euxinus]